MPEAGKSKVAGGGQTVGIDKRYRWVALANPTAAVSLHFMNHNFRRVQHTLGTTPEAAACVADHVWPLAQLLESPEHSPAHPAEDLLQRAVQRRSPPPEAVDLSRLVPQHKMRAMVYTATTATASELHHFGSVPEVVPRAELRDAARRVARDIATKSPTVLRRAKESLNAIDPVDVKRSYRFEQGFTFELNLWGDSDELRQAFVEKRAAELGNAEERRR